MIKVVLLFILIGSFSFGQSYAPIPGEIGSTAIYKDSSVFIGWATGVSIIRGPLNIQNIPLGYASYGVESEGEGVPDGISVVSLGDGGEAIVTFDLPITNGTGPDFAIFENGFTDNYMEFAFVEVSSDGLNFFRFPSVSEIPIDIQLSNFSFSDCRYVHNLAGKYKQNYGTPFDLQDLIGISGLDLNQITHIKLIDVVGCINPLYATTDSQGNIINDPYPTEFESGGFDLDAIGVIHEIAGINELKVELSFYPNPTNGILYMKTDNIINYSILDFKGDLLDKGSGHGLIKIDISLYPAAIYFIQILDGIESSIVKIIKTDK